MANGEFDCFAIRNMYSIFAYCTMIADRVRMEAYTQALRQSITPDTVVLDIGTGTGIFALLACQFGARRVYAIEPDDAIQAGRDIARANGYADRIEFIQDVSTQVELPERAGVVISDMRGILPLLQQHIPSIVDARQRLLVPGGKLIAERDTCWAAVVEAPELYRRHTVPWDDNDYGLDMDAVRRILINTWRKGRVTPEQLLVEPQCWATLDYATVESPDLRGEATWTVTRAGTAHGLIVWFDSILAEGISMTNAPGAPELIYGSAFFPWTQPVALAVGDTVSVVLGADLIGEDYIWRWDTQVLDQGQTAHVKAGFNQTTFYGAPVALAQLHKRAASHVPSLSEDGQIDQLILALMERGTSLGETARQVLERFPRRFTTWEEALTRVGDLSEKYNR
jgi:protein arginine N-methyltransferase 1